MIRINKKAESPAYRRWRRQLEALSNGDLITVKKLAAQAGRDLTIIRKKEIEKNSIKSLPLLNYDHRERN